MEDEKCAMGDLQNIVVIEEQPDIEVENCDTTPHLQNHLEHYSTSNALNGSVDEGKNDGATAVQALSAYNAETRLLDDITLECAGVRTPESSLVADMRELKNELVSLTADIGVDGFGLQSLFAEHRMKPEKSKSAKKRKKQLQKFVKTAPSKPNNNSRWAQCTEELLFGRETDIDSSLTCPVCLELFYLPRACHPCGHIFCDPCLRRLTTQGWEEVPCPLCRSVIQTCDLQQEFNHILRATHPDVYLTRSAFENRSRFRHYKLPYTPPVPLGRRLIRHLRTNARNRQPDASWMSHDWFKFMLGCTVGVCTSLLVMLLNRVKSINDVRDVNIMFLSLILGASLTVVVFKMFKI